MLEAAGDFWEVAVAAVVDELAALLFVDFLGVLVCLAAACMGQTLAAITASSEPTTVVLWSVARIIWLSAAPIRSYFSSAGTTPERNTVMTRSL